jgi:hypothetical protein
MGNVGSDTITITGKPVLKLDLGDDKQICMGNMISLDATQKANVVYNWDDGTTLPVRTIQTPGWYWVKVSGECDVVAMDSILIRSRPRLSLDLGRDTVLCNVGSFEIGSVSEGVQRYRWNDNTESATLLATETGTYEQTIWNECESVRDQITITFVRPDDVFIPNVVTDDGNSKNDKFVLPAIFNESASLAIYNRWGQRVFSSNNYLNNWPQRDEPTGVYFYLLKGSCLGKEYKGNIHLMR